MAKRPRSPYCRDADSPCQLGKKRAIRGSDPPPTDFYERHAQPTATPLSLDSYRRTFVERTARLRCDNRAIRWSSWFNYLRPQSRAGLAARQIISMCCLQMRTIVSNTLSTWASTGQLTGTACFILREQRLRTRIEAQLASVRTATSSVLFPKRDFRLLFSLRRLTCVAAPPDSAEARDVSNHAHINWLTDRTRTCDLTLRLRRQYRLSCIASETE